MLCGFPGTWSWKFTLHNAPGILLSQTHHTVLVDLRRPSHQLGVAQILIVNWFGWLLRK